MLLLTVVSLFIFAVSAAADKYPVKNITYQVTFAAGGASDIRARQQQPVLEKELGVKILIQYKPGGGGSIGWANLVKHKPDGYFISGINIPHIILQPLARKDPGYKTEQILPILLFQEIPFALTVLKNSPFKTLEDLVDYAKKNPGAITVGGSGSWDATHIAHLQFEKMAGIKMTYVPHKGGAPKQTSLLGGHTMASWFGTLEFVAHADRVRNLAIGTDKPVQWDPNLPTFKSKGYNLMSSVYHGVAVPVGTPEEVVKKLEQVFLKIAKDPIVIKRKLDEGFVPISMSSAESKALIKNKIEEWAPIVKQFVK